MRYNKDIEIAVRGTGNTQRLYVCKETHLMKYTPEQQIASFWNRVAITADDNQCWLWLGGKTKRGYGCSRFNYCQVMAHRVAWMIPDYVIPDGMEICHSCDNPSCVNPKHLFLGTRQDNIDDMYAKGREARGEKVSNPGELNPFHKLTSEQVIYIRERYAQGGTSYRLLSLEMNVGRSCIAGIIKGKSWKALLNGNSS